MKIGEVRRNWFLPFDCKWNGLVRDVTAKMEKSDEEVSEPEVVQGLLRHVLGSAKLDATFASRRIWSLFLEAHSGPNQQIATNEILAETLWACRQFIVTHVHRGEEFAIILRIDKALANAAQETAA